MLYRCKLHSNDDPIISKKIFKTQNLSPSSFLNKTILVEVEKLYQTLELLTNVLQIQHIFVKVCDWEMSLDFIELKIGFEMAISDRLEKTDLMELYNNFVTVCKWSIGVYMGKYSLWNVTYTKNCYSAVISIENAQLS